MLEDRQQHLFRRARPRRRLEDDDLSLTQYSGDLPRRRLDDGEVRLALTREWRGQRDQNRVRLAQLLVARGRVDEPALDERSQPLARDVGNVRLAAVESGDDIFDHVDEEDATVGLGERGRQRHADVSGADDCDVVVRGLSHGRQG